MAESHVVRVLVAKRAELAGEIQRRRRELEQVVEQVNHLDSTIRLFAPELDLGSIRPRARRAARRVFAAGECQRLVLETLREADEPLADRQIQAAVAARKAVDLAVRSEDAAGLEKTALATLRRLAKKGAIREATLADVRRAWASG